MKKLEAETAGRKGGKTKAGGRGAVWLVGTNNLFHKGAKSCGFKDRDSQSLIQ